MRPFNGPKGGPLLAAGVLLMLQVLLDLGLAAAVVPPWWRAAEADRSLGERLAGVVRSAAGNVRPCPWLATGAGARPLVLLVLGQSNAANHGGEEGPPAAGGTPSVTVFDGQVCRRVSDPLPGGTGAHHAIWMQLEAALAHAGEPREVVVHLLAVDSTSIDDWTREGSPLRALLDQHLQAVGAGRMPVDFVLWQHGESDARLGTTAARYGAGFESLRGRLRQAGVGAPIVAALSTRCGSPGAGAQVRRAVEDLVAAHNDVLLGPDTDTLPGPLRNQDCHFTAAGLQAAAGLWALALAPRLP